jgi:metal-responsive CopG/Arc/MetJ family transcriptional regulator
VTAKVLISVDQRLLRRIDRTAREKGLTRSAYLAQLAEQDIARTLGPGRDPAARRALRSLDRLVEEAPPGDSTAAIRAERDAR